MLKTKIVFLLAFLIISMQLPFVFSVEIVYSGVYWNITEITNPHGLEFNTTHFWLTDPNKKCALLYSSNGSYTGVSFNFTEENNFGDGIGQDENFVYIGNRGNPKVFKYYRDNLTYSGEEFPLRDGEIREMVVKDNKIWTLHHYVNGISRYDSHGNYESSFSIPDWNDLFGLEYFKEKSGEKLWIVDITARSMREYNLDGTFTGFAFDLSNEMNKPHGIGRNETHLFVGSVDPPRVHVYFIKPDPTEEGEERGLVFKIIRAFKSFF